MAFGKSRATLWRHPGFRLYLTGQCASLSGSAVSTVAVPAIAVLDLYATVTQVAVLTFLGQLPSFMVALPAGVLADRYSKRFLMIAGDLIAAVIVVSIPISAALDTLTIQHLYGAAFLLGVAKVVHEAAAISYLPDLVEQELLQNANSKIGAAFSVADSAGNSVGAALLAVLGAARSVFADAVSHLVSAWCVWRIRAPEQVRPSARPGLISGISEGLRYVAGHETIRSLILALSMLSFALGIMNTYRTYYLLSTLNWSPAAVGLVMGVAGIGSLAGALLAPRLGNYFGPGPLIIIGFALTPLTEIPLLFASPGSVWQIVLAASLMAQLACAGAAGTTQRSTRQVLCELGYQARMQSASTWLTAGSRPLAAAVAGVLVAALGVRAAFAVGTALMLVPIAILLFSPIRTLRTFPTRMSTGSDPAKKEEIQL
ncbi:MFS transporter [Streptomyces sp. B-S-A8]|uniref:MFS transporter n=1 Tax=Streptomyces solicavernae TaxID=3043614 RepID=A0ABT6S1U1_9ACTN|nr:MFS transporter [Streptomyces sp. B-S-A8]MDI3390661.1 MFS transporter [Streptomyces sp. B-S-A8]